MLREKQLTGMRMTRGECTTRRALRRKYSGQHLKKAGQEKRPRPAIGRAGVEALSGYQPGVLYGWCGESW